MSGTVTANTLGYDFASITDVTLNHFFILVGDLHIRVHAETALLLPGDLHSFTLATDRHLYLPFFFGHNFYPTGSEKCFEVFSAGTVFRFFVS